MPTNVFKVHILYNIEKMAWKNDSIDVAELKYDLRVTRAEVIDNVLKAIAVYRSKRNFIDWFNSLEDLYIEIAHRLSDTAKTKCKEARKEATRILNNNSQTYLGNDNDPKKKYEVFEALRTLDLTYKDSMEEANFFGTSWEDDGL